MAALEPVLATITPVILLIGSGVLAAKRGWIEQAAVKSLSNLAFMLFAPALLFRSMSQVSPGAVDLKPIALYFAVAIFIMALVFIRFGISKRAAIIALSSIFSNTFMIGAPLVSLAFGQQGLVLLLVLISLHALVLLSVATFVFELAESREKAERPRMALSLLNAVKSSVLHPVPLPILIGLAFGATGLVLPKPVDATLLLLGQAFPPTALVLVGVSLAATPIGAHLVPALKIVAVKNIAQPLLMLGAGLLFNVAPLPLAVMVVCAALPIGANVFLFAQRYQVEPQLASAAIAVSNIAAALTTSLALLLVPLLKY